MIAVLKIVLGIVEGIFRAYVLSFLWQWFFAEPFGLPVIGAAHMYGIALIPALLGLSLVELMESQISKTLSYRRELAYLACLFGSLVTWGVGYIVRGMR